jgi:ABC-type transport system involved in multi-copper enzyme maturation permease subunit
MTLTGFLGPVLAYELRRSARRWQMYAQRAAFITLLLTVIYLIWQAHVDPGRVLTLRAGAKIGETVFHVIIVVQLAFVFLAAPPAVAGAACQDRLSGVLADMLATELSAAEILMGRLIACLAAVLIMVASSLPVLFAAMLLGGIEDRTLVGAILVTAAVVLLCCTMALSLAIFGGKTYEVTFATYTLLLAVFFIEPFWSWLAGHQLVASPPPWVAKLNPFWVALEAYYNPGLTTVSMKGPIYFLVGSMLAGTLLFALAAWHLSRRSTPRAVPNQSAAGAARRSGLYARTVRPLLALSPSLWLECRCGWQSGWTRAIWILYWVVAGCVTAVLVGQSAVLASAGIAVDSFARINSLQMTIGLLLLTIPSITSFSEDRARGTLAVMLTTPVSKRTIILSKWLGVFRMAPLLAILPCALIGSLELADRRFGDVSLFLGLMAGYGAALVSLGLYLSLTMASLGRALASIIVTFVFVTAGWALFMIFVPTGIEEVRGLVAGLAYLALIIVWGVNLIAYAWPTSVALARVLQVYFALVMLTTLSLTGWTVVGGSTARDWVLEAALGLAGLFFVVGMAAAALAARRRRGIAGVWAVYFIFCASLPPALVGIALQTSGFGDGVQLASPWLAGQVGVTAATNRAIGPPWSYLFAQHSVLSDTRGQFFFWVLYWIIAFAGAAAFLLTAIHESFDHYLERMPDWQEPRKELPPTGVKD